MGQGILPNMFHGIGKTYDPARMKSATFGAYQRGLAQNIGAKTQDVAGGAVQMAANFLSAGNAGGMLGGAIGGAMIPIPIVGSMIGEAIGSTVAAPLNVLNPLAYGAEELRRATFFGDQANHASSGFLRGRQGFQLGRFGASEEMNIGLGVRKAVRKDLTLDNDDISELMRGGAEQGMFLGVQNADQYVARFKQKLDSAKLVMKLANVAMSEGVDLMSDAMNGMGFATGAKMQSFFGKIGSAAPLAGLSFQQMMGVAQGGAQTYAGAGMMSTLGAHQAVQSRALAGMGASFTVGTPLLASVGGEEGLHGLIARSGQQYLQGTAGTVMALGGGGYGSFGQGFSRAAGAMQTSGDMVSFMANKHTRMEQAVGTLGPMGVQAMQARDLLQLANEYGGIGGSTLDRMKVLAKSQYGLSDTEADALVKSMQALPEAMEQQRFTSGRQFNDMLGDQVRERFSLKSRVRMGYRNVMEGEGGSISKMMRVGDRIDSVGRAIGGLGDYAEHKSRDVMDYFSGIERDYVNKDTFNRLEKMKDLSIFEGGDSGMGGTINSGDMMRRISYLRANSRTGGAIDKLAAAASKGSGRNAAVMMAAVQYGMDSGKEFRSERELLEEYVRKTGGSLEGVNAQDLITTASLMGVSQDSVNAIGAHMGVKVEPKDKLMSESDLTKALSGLGVGNYGGGDKRMLAAASNEVFQQVVRDIQQLFNAYDPMKGTKQGADFERKAQEIGRKIQQINDPESQQLLKSMMEQAGVSISSDGSISFAGAMDKMEQQLGLGGAFLGTADTEEARTPEAQAALKAYTQGQSIGDIAKSNKAGADFLKRMGSRLENVNVGMVGGSAQNRTIGALEAITKREDRMAGVQALNRGLRTFGDKGSGARAAGLSALGAINMDEATVDKTGIGRAFRGMSDEDLNALYSSDNESDREIAKIATRLQAGKIQDAEAGEMIGTLIMKRGNVAGETVGGANADRVLAEEEMAGSQAVKEMLKSMEVNTSVNHEVLRQLKMLNGMAGG